MKINKQILLLTLSVFGLSTKTFSPNPDHSRADIEELFDSLIFKKNTSKISEDSFNELFNQANNLLEKKKIDDAIILYKKALSINNNHVQLHYCLGVALLENNTIDEAIVNFNNVIEQDPSHSQAHLSLAKCYEKKNNLEEAKKHYYRTIECDSSHREAFTELARILCDQQDFDQSIKLLEQLRSQHPDDTLVLFQLANTLNTAHKNEESLTIYNYLLKKHPNSAAIAYNTAYTLKKMGRIQEALPLYEKTLALSPEHAEAHFSRGLAYLAIGDFERGWPEYEWRWKRDTQAMEKRNLSKPLWDGSELHNKTILLHAEQGLGDTFQFIRYAKVAHDMGGTVIAAVQNPLIDILSLCPYIDRVVSLNAPLPHFDVHAPLMSVPHILRTTEASIPQEIPYLYAHAQLTEEWREKLASDNNFKIGICWQGNLNYSTPFLRAVVAAKSIKLAQLAPLFNIPGVSVYNLQKITGEEQQKDIPAEWNLISFDENFDSTHGRFMDTAAVIKNLDLIITVDTGLAHIAAGLGAQVWTFIPNPPDWRWMLDRTDTPWYPNMRLFRQQTIGDWDSVIKHVADELQLLINHKELMNAPKKTLGDIIDTIIFLNIKYGTKSPQKAQEIEALHKEFALKPLSINAIDAIKQLSIELSRIHNALGQITMKMQQHENLMSNDYQRLAKEYINLQQARNDIKNKINTIE